MKILLLFLALAAVTVAQVGVPLNPSTYPDVAGANSTTQLATTGGCSAIQLLADSGNSYVIRWGGVSTTSAQGGTIAPGAGQFLPYTGNNYYPLASLYVYVQTGDTFRFVCFR